MDVIQQSSSNQSIEQQLQQQQQQNNDYEHIQDQQMEDEKDAKSIFEKY